MGKSDYSESTNQSTPVKENTQYKYNEDGRRYHGKDDAVYLLPNDDEETERLNQQHFLIKSIIHGNYCAPVENFLKDGATVLDSACGTGIWIIDLAKEFPTSKFYGIDISEVSTDKSTPSNAYFVMDNITKSIPFPDNSVDFIHQRLVLSSFTDDNWNKALTEMYRVLKPGGYIELVEMDFYNMISIGPKWTKMRDTMFKVYVSKDIPVNICSEIPGRLTKAGFVDEVEKSTDLPFNHGGEYGKLLWEDKYNVFSSLRPVLAKFVPEWEDNGVYRQYLIDTGIESTEYKSGVRWCNFYARKFRQV